MEIVDAVGSPAIGFQRRDGVDAIVAERRQDAPVEVLHGLRRDSGDLYGVDVDDAGSLFSDR